MNYFVLFIALVLFLLLLISIVNLVSIIKLKKQTDFILNSNLIVYTQEEKKSVGLISKEITRIDENSINITSPSSSVIRVVEEGSIPPASNPLLENIEPSKVYSNGFSEPFFNSVFINTEKTNMYLDEKMTALTFYPVYDFNHNTNCDQPFCGAMISENISCLKDKCLSLRDEKIYYQGEKIDLPIELKDKNIIKTAFNSLDSKWVLTFLVSDSGQEIVYAYFFDGDRVSPIIDNSGAKTTMKTSLGMGGGNISVGGSDNHFIILYSGYEGLAYLYNNGLLQNISQFFSLRVTNRGFKAKIIKSGEGTLANWYICSEGQSQPKLIKLWQNDTKSIQGGIDLSNILKNKTSICSYNKEGELNIYQEQEAYIFKDQGFNNKQDYIYQSVNFSNLTGKRIALAYINSLLINVRPDLYSLFFSVDGYNWQKVTSELTNLSGASDKLYVKAEFMTAEATYSPWFDGLNSVSYKAVD